MYVGPGDGGPGIEFSICSTTKCDGTYDQYLHPGGGDFPVGKRIPIRVVSTGGRTQFYVDNALSVEYAGDSSPITDFQFSMYANKGAAFRVTVENLCVQYAGK